MTVSNPRALERLLWTSRLQPRTNHTDTQFLQFQQGAYLRPSRNDQNLMPLRNKENESEKTTIAGAVHILKESAFRQALMLLPLQGRGGGGGWTHRRYVLHLGFPILLLVRVTYYKKFLTGLLTFLPSPCPSNPLSTLSS